LRRFVATADLFLGARQISGFHNDGKVLVPPREVALDKVLRIAIVLKQESLATMHSTVETPVDLRQANAPIRPRHRPRMKPVTAFFTLRRHVMMV
jgi:hypothetical protein